jgi:hypothetical protein
MSNRRWRQATAELAHDYPARISGWPSPRRERTSFNQEHQQPTDALKVVRFCAAPFPRFSAQCFAQWFNILSFAAASRAGNPIDDFGAAASLTLAHLSSLDRYGVLHDRSKFDLVRQEKRRCLSRKALICSAMVRMELRSI